MAFPKLQTKLPMAVLKKKGVNHTKELKKKIDIDDIPLEKKNARLYHIGIVVSVVFVIFSITLFGLKISSKGLNKSVPLKEVEETVEEVETEKEEIIQLDREEITLEILNASGVAGAAGDMKEIFEDFGYSDIEVGNADDAEGNELYIDPEYKDLVDLLLEDVEDELDIEETLELEDEDAIEEGIIARIILSS